MTVTGSYQAFSFTALRLSIGVSQTAPSSPAAISETPAAADTVSLSPAATTGGAAATDQAPADPAGSETPAGPADAPPSRAQRRADALFGALDADKNGSITEQEFTDGATALLRRAGDRHRLRGHDGGHRAHDGDGTGRSSRLEQKLEAAFARVDANQDGAIDQDELTTALAKAGGKKGRHNGSAPADPPPPPDATPAAAGGTTVTFSFTYVSVAVQRYTTLQPPTPAPAPETILAGAAAAPAATTASTAPPRA